MNIEKYLTFVNWLEKSKSIWKVNLSLSALATSALYFGFRSRIPIPASIEPGVLMFFLGLCFLAVLTLFTVIIGFFLSSGERGYAKSTKRKKEEAELRHHEENPFEVLDGDSLMIIAFLVENDKSIFRATRNLAWGLLETGLVQPYSPPRKPLPKVNTTDPNAPVSKLPFSPGVGPSPMPIHYSSPHDVSELFRVVPRVWENCVAHKEAILQRRDASLNSLHPLERGVIQSNWDEISKTLLPKED